MVSPFHFLPFSHQFVNLVIKTIIKSKIIFKRVNLIFIIILLGWPVITEGYQRGPSEWSPATQDTTNVPTTTQRQGRSILVDIIMLYLSDNGNKTNVYFYFKKMYTCTSY
jgi:hypothetical protein